jgi:UDPglucose 6-dehydrogenase
MTTISMIGVGYVGLVSAACLADFGNYVTCVDTDIEKIAALQDGRIPIYEPGLDEVIERNIKAWRIQFTTDFVFSVKQNDVTFIAVGTPPADDGSADLGYAEQAARGIGQFIEKYTVIVDKSTVPVGTGRKVATWIEEKLKNKM